MSSSIRVNPVLRRLAFLGNFGGLIFPLGAVALLLPLAVIAYQLKNWFETGHWPAVSFADGLHWVNLPSPHFESATIQRTFESLLKSPLSLVLLFGVGGFLIAYAQFAKWLERYSEPEKAAHEL